MCGRVRCTLRADDVPRACHLNHNPVRTVNADRYRQSYNAAPGSHLPVVRRGSGSDGQGFVVHYMKWGLIPSFTKKTEKPDHYKMFNARSESISEKASFRRLVPKNRCLVAAEGYYEWKKVGPKKQPYYIHFKDSRPLIFAALYDAWDGSEGETLYTVTILTTSASSALQWLHDRMPVIFGDKVSIDAWLNGSCKVDALLKPYEVPDLVKLGWYPVTPAMGKSSFDGPECIQEMQLKTEVKNPIENFFVKKIAKSKKDANLKAEELHEESSKMDMQKSLKEELDSEGNSLGMQIQLKTEVENPTENFFFKKEIKSEDPNLQAEESRKESSKTDKQKNLKEKPDSEDYREYASLAQKGDNDSKSNVSSLSCERDGQFNLKRDYEEFLVDSRRTAVESNKVHANPAKKKGNLRAGDKQPTLFSYLGKS